MLSDRERLSLQREVCAKHRIPGGTRVVSLLKGETHAEIESDLLTFMRDEADLSFNPNLERWVPNSSNLLFTKAVVKRGKEIAEIRKRRKARQGDDLIDQALREAGFDGTEGFENWDDNR